LDPRHELGKLACYQATPHSHYFQNTTLYIYFDIIEEISPKLLIL
jgi:hypothetical protein